VGKQGRDDNKTFQYTTFLHIDLLPKLQKKKKKKKKQKKKKKV